MMKVCLILAIMMKMSHPALDKITSCKKFFVSMVDCGFFKSSHKVCLCFIPAHTRDILNSLKMFFIF